MHKYCRAAGAFVAAAALSVVATPAHASADAALAGAASIATSKSVVAQLPAETDMNARFKPWRCDERKYFRKHTRKCIRFFEDYYDRDNDRRGDRDRDRDRRDGDRRDGDRRDGDRRDGDGFSGNERRGDIPR